MRVGQRFLLLVGASPPKIENRLKITELELNYLVFELVSITTFDIIYVGSWMRQLVFYMKAILISKKYLMRSTSRNEHSIAVALHEGITFDVVFLQQPSSQLPV